MAANNEGFSKNNVPPDSSTENTLEQCRNIDNFVVDDDVDVQRWSLAAMNRYKPSVPMPSKGTTVITASPSIERRLFVKAHKAVQRAMAGMQNSPKPSVRMPSKKTSFIATSSRERCLSVKAHKAMQRAMAVMQNSPKPSVRMPSKETSFIATSSSERCLSDEYVEAYDPYWKLEEPCLVCGKKQFPDEDKEFCIVAFTVEDILMKFLNELSKKRKLDLRSVEDSSTELCPLAYLENLKMWSKRNLRILIGEVGYPETDEDL